MKQIRDKSLLQHISLLIKELREGKKLTQEEVYNEIHIHIARIETGKNNLTVSTLSEICRFFGITLSDFHKEIESRKEKENKLKNN